MPVRHRASPALGAALLAAAWLHVGCARPAPPRTSPAGGVAPTWPMRGAARVVEGRRAVVVSGSPIASAIGVDILRAGGNAVDAAAAVGFALAVVHPEAGNVGGGGFMLIRERGGRVHALDYRETAPGRATRDMFLDPAGRPTDRSLTGHLAAGVPGSPAGLVEAHRRFGRLPLAAVVEPAVRLARDGFAVDEYRSRSIAADSARLARFPASRAAFLPGGRPPAPGATLRQPDLAATLAAIRDRGAAGFYRGPVARQIAEEMERGGGLISLADLAAYRALWRDPVAIRYRGHTVYSVPPASSGGITMGVILNVMEGFGRLPPFGSALLMHREGEAMRRAFVDRNTWLGDPAFVRVPVARLLSAAHAAELRAGIGPRATPTPAIRGLDGRGASTTHYSVVDPEGNAVSCTTTLNDSYGSAVTVAGAGFLLNNEMDDFSVAPDHPNLYGLVQGEANAIAPGKRMLSSMTPAIVTDSAGLRLVVGTPGGPRIITMVYHVISNVVDHGMTLADAVEAPRLHHQALPDTLGVEAGGFTAAVLDSLRALGHAVAEGGRWGDVEAIGRSPQGGWQGVSDPRRGGGGAAY